MTSAVHIPKPSGPHSTGAVDVMVGRTKDGTFLRIFYPSDILDINTQINRWTTWNLGKKYIEGWGKFHFPILTTFYVSMIHYLFKNILVPAIWEAPVRGEKYPVIIFSHGLTANRSLASTTCIEIASHGYFVAAVEHRDGSANASFILNENREKIWVPFTMIQKRENEYQIRNNQIETRYKEVSKALDTLELLNKNAVKNELESSFDLGQFKDKMDLSNPTISGHSFGGGTALLTLAKDKRFTGGILLDPWLFPLKDDINNLTSSIKQPLLFILMETFQNKDNIAAMKPFQELNSQFVTIRKANHVQQTDVPLILPSYLHSLGGCRAAIKPLTVMQLNNKLIMKFLWENSEEKSELLSDYKIFLERYEKHLIFKAQGSAKSMLGWNSLPKSSS